MEDLMSKDKSSDVSADAQARIIYYSFSLARLQTRLQTSLQAHSEEGISILNFLTT